MKRQQHQRQLDDLNDASAGRIILSILCLGLDRAILGIKSLIDQDAVRIKILRDEMARFNEALEKGVNQLDVARELCERLSDEQQANQEIVRKLEAKSATLHQEEKATRLKLASITQIAGFYGKLKAVCEGVRENINWIKDIIDELNDDQPRIIDFDASGQELIPLRTALARLDNLLNSDEVQETFISRSAALDLA